MDNERFQETVLQQLQVLAEGQGRLETRLGNVEQGQAQLAVRLDGVEARLGNVETRLENVEQGQAQLGIRLDGVEARLGTVEKSQLRLEARFEGEIIDKIRALFDDREVQKDSFARIEHKLNSIAEGTHYLIAQFAQLEGLSR